MLSQIIGYGVIRNYIVRRIYLPSNWLWSVARKRGTATLIPDYSTRWWCQAPATLNSGKNGGTLWIGGRTAPRAGLYILENRKIRYSLWCGVTQCGLVQCVRKVPVLLQNVMEVMSTSVDTGLNPFNFIRNHILQIWLSDVSYVRSYCSF
jgi:hypothetical protein